MFLPAYEKVYFDTSCATSHICDTYIKVAIENLCTVQKFGFALSQYLSVGKHMRAFQGAGLANRHARTAASVAAPPCSSPRHLPSACYHYHGS